MNIVLTLPPSVNSLYRTSSRGHTYKTDAGRSYIEGNAWLIRNMMRPVKGRISVSVKVYYPDNRVRDNSNLWKVIDDTIKESGIIPDDCWQYYPKQTIEAIGIDRKNPRIEMDIDPIV